MVVYLTKCHAYGKKCNGKTMTKFCTRANNYKSTHYNFRKEQKLSNQARNQKHLHEHLHKTTILDQAKTEKSLQQKELCWYHNLKTYAPFDVNERDVFAAC